MKNLSLRRKILLLMVAGTGLVLASLLIDHILLTHLMKKDVATQYQNLLDERVSKVDELLRNEEISVMNFANYNSHIDGVMRARNETEYYFETRRAKKDMDFLPLLSLTEVAFFVKEDAGNIHCGISQYASMSAYENRDLENYIKTAAPEDLNTKNQWRLVKIGESWFFMYGFNRKECIFGLCFRPEALLDALGLNVEESNCLTVLNDAGKAVAGEAYFQKGEMTEEDLASMKGSVIYDSKSVAIAAYSNRIGRRIFYIGDNILSNSMQGIASLLRITSFVVMATFVLVFAASYYSVRKPLQALKESISDARNGELQTTVQIQTDTPREFAETYQLFNEMMGEIKNLKIASYESELERQKYEIQFLITQIKPHFYLNAMKYLYALAQRKQYDTMQKILLELSSYFRYLTYDSHKLVTVLEEWGHVEEYLSVLTSGVRSDIKISADISEDAKQINVPKLFIQTFMENAVKYAVRDDGSLNVDLKLTVIGGADPYLSMVIQDNGKGFSQAYLDDIQENGFRLSEKHVGISNLYHRLMLLYGNQIYLNVGNQAAGGAIIEVMIPAKTAEEDSKREEPVQEYENPDCR